VNHYPHHIGDFDKATRHLTRVERSIYRDLIELYYDTETVLTLDLPSLCRRILARSNEESTAVEQTLNEFFIKTASGWYHERCEQEIEAFRSGTTQKSLAGKASAAARAKKREENLQKLNGVSTLVERSLNSVSTAGNGTPTNLEPRTYNQEPTEELAPPKDSKPPENPKFENPSGAVEVSKAIVDAFKAKNQQCRANAMHPDCQKIADMKIPMEFVTSVAEEGAADGKAFAWVLAAVLGKFKDAKERIDKPREARIDWSDSNHLNVLGQKIGAPAFAGETTQRYAVRLQALIADRKASEDKKLIGVAA
jgi:uncharacterized protein YdaU (DUF1376 family)